ncbi:MAG: HlyC/CorC family transporter [Anaerolineaceae bacterium]|nr:HlyC/CorC family transporter [Anaerolineaceae bacterium]
MPIYVNIILIFVLFFFNAIFAMYEIAMVAARKTRLQQRVEAGSVGAKRALTLLADPNQQYLSTVQIMITLIDTLAGGIGGATLADPLARQLERISFLAAQADLIALILVVTVITYFSIVMGELIPKRLAVSKPEAVVTRLSPVIFVMTKIFRPLTRLLSISTNVGLKILHINTDMGPSITEEEIKGFIDEGREIGVIEDAERDMFSGIFRLGDRRVEALMTPRMEMAWIDVNAPKEEIWQQIKEVSHSRVPVAEGNLDNVLGYIQTRDLLGHKMNAPDFDLRDFILEPIYVPENMAALKALENIQTSGVHLAMVVDEFGGITGMVTDYDILEAIVGEIPEDSADRDYMAVQREDGSWLFDGLIVVDELKELLNIHEMVDEDRAGYQTLSGFVMSQLGRIPKTGAKFTYDNYEFEVVDMDGRRVDRVLVTPITEEA